MSRNAETSTSIQEPASEITGSTRMSVAVIGPNAAHRRVVAKALTGSESRTVREFVDYPAKLTDVQRLMEQQRFDVVMIDVDSDQSYALQVVQKFAAIENVMVMVYSKRNDPALLRSCLEAGARDFLPLPAEADAEDEPPPAAVPQEAVRTAPAVPSAPPEIPRTHSTLPDILKTPPAPSNDNMRAVASPSSEFAPMAPAPMPDILRTTPPPAQETTKIVPASAQESFYRAPMSMPESVQLPEPAFNAASHIPAAELSAADARVMPSNREFSSLSEPSAATVLSQPQSRSAQPGDPASTDFTAWDNAWIRATNAPANGSETKPRLVDTPSSKAKTGRLLGGPQKIARTPAPIEKSPTETALFREVESRDSEASSPNWKKWSLIAAVPVALTVVLSLVVFMRPSRQAAPVAPETSTVAPQTDLSAATSTPNAQTPAIAKPSPSSLSTAPVASPAAPVNAVASDMMNAQLAAPSRIAGTMKKSGPVEDAPPAGFTPGSMESGSAIPGAVFGSQSNVKVVPAVSAISAGVAAGMLLHKNEPIYPQFAKDAHMGGTVVLGATITAAGTIAGLHVLSGPEIFRGPATDAVKTWRYRPYKLNNEPVEVQTTIKVIFSLEQH
jgi:protein TonB